MIRVTQDCPCPICGHDKWCSFSDNGEWVYCPRTNRPGVERIGELGWRYPNPGVIPPIILPYDYESFQTYWYNLPSSIPSHSPFEGIPIGFIDEYFLIKDDITRRSWVYPMYNVNGMSGLQFRDGVGNKKSYPGTRLGLFMPRDWDVGTPTVYICEGFSDTVAMAYAGFKALGRACATHNKAVVEYVETYSPERVIIVADNDEIGIKGANSLQSLLLLHTECGILIPVLKDARESLRKLGRL